jgi:hypothetical protein
MSSILFDESEPKRLENDAQDFHANALRNFSVAYSELLHPNKNACAQSQMITATRKFLISAPVTRPDRF